MYIKQQLFLLVRIHAGIGRVGETYIKQQLFLLLRIHAGIGRVGETYIKQQLFLLLPEPGRSTLNVLNYKYKYFLPGMYLSTSTFLFGEMYLQ